MGFSDNKVGQYIVGLLLIAVLSGLLWVVSEFLHESVAWTGWAVLCLVYIGVGIYIYLKTPYKYVAIGMLFSVFLAIYITVHFIISLVADPPSCE